MSQRFKLKGKKETDHHDAKRQMSSEIFTLAKFDDLWSHWFPVSGSLMLFASESDKAKTY